MTETLTIHVMGKKMDVAKGTTLYDLSKRYRKEFKYPIIIAKVNGIYKELFQPIENNWDIEFLDTKNRMANRAYLNGLTLLTIYAAHSLWGSKANIEVMHSIDKGIYIETSFSLTQDKVEKLKEKMHQLVEMDLKFVKYNVNKREAMNYFEKRKDFSKVGLLNYNTNNYITLYRLENEYNYFFSKMPCTTGCLKDFDLVYLNDHGFVLMYQTIYLDGISKYVHHPEMFKVFSENKDWVELMKINNSSSLNRMISSGKIGDIIRIDETLQSNRLLKIARDIYSQKDKIKVILMAGPSSSGKTTTCRKLSMYLRSFGLLPREISMDNYFVDRDKTPKDENGEYDFECLEALNLDLFNQQVKELLEGKEVLMPTYDFISGKSSLNATLKLEENSILLIEGIHGLNPKLLETIPNEAKYKIYLSPLTVLNIDNHNRVSTTDNRLLRRIVRDNRTRGHSVNDTLKIWSKVRNGEEKYIFPYQDEADCIFNTAFIYELGILKTYVEPLLYSVDHESEYYEVARRLLNMLKTVLPIPSEAIPDDSLLREFIGGSCFE